MGGIKMRRLLLFVSVGFFFLMAGIAGATPYEFVFTDTIKSASTPGINVGDTFTAKLDVDNGGSTTINQSWSNMDTWSIVIKAGSYFAIYGNHWTDLNLTTDASGNVSSVTFPGTGINPWNTDSFGTWASNAIFANGVFVDSQGRSNTIEAETFNNSGQWVLSETFYYYCYYYEGSCEETIMVAGASIPEPATMLLLGLGLMGLAGLRRTSKS